MTPFLNPEAVRRAIDWAKANPDNIIAGGIAQDDRGRSTSTLNPTACCFCILGVIARESGCDVDTTDAALVCTLGDDFDGDYGNAIWVENDHGVNSNEPLKGAEYVEGLLNDA